MLSAKMKIFSLLITVFWGVNICAAEEETPSILEDFESCLSQMEVGKVTRAEQEEVCLKKGLEKEEKDMREVVAKIKDDYKEQIKGASDKTQKRRLIHCLKTFEKSQKEFEKFIQSFFKRSCEIYGSRAYNGCYYSGLIAFIRLRITLLKDD